MYWRCGSFRVCACASDCAEAIDPARAATFLYLCVTVSAAAHARAMDADRCVFSFVFY